MSWRRGLYSAALSLLTVAQRLHSVRCSPGAIDPLRPDVPEGQ